MRLRLPLLCLAALAAAPSAAGAAPRAAEVLVDTPPAAHVPIRDRVVTGTTARAARAGGAFEVIRAADGSPVRVRLSPSYAANPAVARSYVAFLSGLVHGPELGLLEVDIATPGEVSRMCGRAKFVACYFAGPNRMVVPGEQPAPGVSTAQILAHEYGHHVANHRSNAPFESLHYGPKRWASERDVCAKALAGRVSPGDEGTNYASNPGEAWAETYAQLKYPAVPWSLTPLLRPRGRALAAARRDVTHPWRGNRTRVLSGVLGGRDRRDTFRLRIALDGNLRVALDGPRRAGYDLILRRGGRFAARTVMAGAGDAVGYGRACFRRPQRLSVTVVRRSGAGPYRLRVTYAG